MKLRGKKETRSARKVDRKWITKATHGLVVQNRVNLLVEGCLVGLSSVEVRPVGLLLVGDVVLGCGVSEREVTSARVTAEGKNLPLPPPPDLHVEITPASCIPLTLRKDATELRKTSGAHPSHPRPARGERPRGPPLQARTEGQRGSVAKQECEGMYVTGERAWWMPFPLNSSPIASALS